MGREWGVLVEVTLCMGVCQARGFCLRWKPGLVGGRTPLEGGKQSFFAWQAIGGVGPCKIKTLGRWVTDLQLYRASDHQNGPDQD